MLGNTKVLTKGILDAVKHSRPIYHVGRKLRFALGDSLGARPVDGISGRVHYNDFMLNSTAPADVAYYLRELAAQFRQLPTTQEGMARVLSQYYKQLPCATEKHPTGCSTENQIIWDEAVRLLQNPVSQQVKAATFKVSHRACRSMAIAPF